MGIDYYGVLSLKKNSTDLEIKKAYRHMALQFCQEKLKDENVYIIFSLICEAYDVLGDPLKRAIYDQYGEEGLKRGVPGPREYYPPYAYHGEPMRTYKEFFGTASPYADLLDYLIRPSLMGNMVDSKSVKKKQDPIYHPLALTLHEIYFGGVKKMKIHRLVFVDEQQSRTEVREKILTVPIKPGIKPGTEITFPEEGDQNPNQLPADVIFVTEDRPHETFTRVGDDLIMHCSISLQESLLGTTITVKTLDHRTIRVPITDIVFANYEKVVENEGMPKLENSDEKGNLILRFETKHPSYLPQASRDMIKKAFEIARSGGSIDQHDMINKIVLADKMKRIDRSEQLPPI